MQYTLATAALVATAAATGLGSLTTVDGKPFGISKVVNRCSYPVYLWAIDKELGCTPADRVKLTTGQSFQEQFKPGTNGGISIKLSKYDTCSGKDITQLEYKIVNDGGDFDGNYLDMSFVDCTTNIEDCPGRTDGFYLKSGNTNGEFKTAVNNEHCPIFNVYNTAEAAAVSYIKWDDRQTKFCQANADLSLYLCGGEAPGEEDDSSSSASPSSQVEETPSPSSTVQEETTPAVPTSTEEAQVAVAAAITEAPVVVAAAPVVKTEVVYVTEFVKRHEHAHGRRHQHFHA